MIITEFNGSPLSAAKEQEINAAVEVRFKVGFSFCDICNTQLLRSKFLYLKNFQLCPGCYENHPEKPQA